MLSVAFASTEADRRSIRAMVPDGDLGGGLRDSFSDFYETRRDVIVRAVWGAVGDRDLAGEAVDEAMTRAFARWGYVSSVSNPEGWVYRTARNWATSSLRRLVSARRYRHLVASPDAQRQPTADGSEFLLRDLSVVQRDVLVLRFLLDLSIEQTSEVLDISHAAVRSRTNRAIERLRNTDESDGDEHAKRP